MPFKTTKKVETIEPFPGYKGKAITDCKMVDVFYPVREDYK